VISELRPYQQDCIQAICDSLRGGVRRLVVQAATGAGKTKIAAELVERALRKGNRTAFVVPAIALVDQTRDSFLAEGIEDVGVIQADHPMTDWSKPVQICSIQTIRARKAYPAAKAVIFDEVHQLHEAHKAWLGSPDWQQVPFIGLSATPWTRGLGSHFSSLLVAATTAELIEQGYLAPFRVFATGHPDLGGVRITAGDYAEDELAEAMQQGELVGDIVRTWREKWGQGKTLCFGVNKAHAQNIQARFEGAGVPCGYQDAETSPDERREVKRKFHNGEYQVVCNIQTLTTGVDWDVRCLILARPTKSEMLYVQIIGRALRTADGKDNALILDHSDTTQRLGFVTDIHRDHLDDGSVAAKKKRDDERKTPLPKECKSCGHLNAARVRVCANCGEEQKRESTVMEHAGELVEVTGGTKGRSRQKKPEEFTTGERIVFFAELRTYGMNRGYKPGWAAAKFKERFGAWPPRSWDNMQPAESVSAITKSWIVSRNIAWAKAKEARGATHAGAA
jgi:DNA repair protein RadD